MSSFKIFCWITLVALLSACMPQTKKINTNNALIGAWEVKSVTWISDEKTQNIEPAQAGMFVFNQDHYALMWSPQSTPRTPFNMLSKPTDEEILQGFRSIVFNAGSYKVEGKKMVATARVAKVPGFEGGQLYYRFVFNGDDLILTLYDEVYPDGTKPDWSGTWKTEFKLAKAKK